MGKIFWIKINEEIFKINKNEFTFINALENSELHNGSEKEKNDLEKVIIREFNDIRKENKAIKSTNKYVFPLKNLNKIYEKHLENEKNRSEY